MTENIRHKFATASWRYLSYGIAALVLAPILVVFASWLMPIATEHWDHLLEYLLPSLLWQTAVLLLGVCGMTLVIGVSLAWLCSQYRFPGVALLRRGLILPFAIPAYVSAFVFVGMMDYSGPVRTLIRQVFGGDGLVPEVRSLPGGILVLALCLFPYVYVFSFDAFTTQGRSSLEAARSLGASPLTSFYRLAVPFARPWIAGALCLVALEVLNDFGTVSIIGVNTFTTAIYKVWFGFFAPETAAQLSTFLVTLAFLIYYTEQGTRRRHQYTSNHPNRAYEPYRLRGWKAGLAGFYAWLIFGLAFLIPVVQLIIWVVQTESSIFTEEVFQPLYRSIILGTCAATLACFFALIVCLAKRYLPIESLRRSQQVSHLGYGIPGSVMAIGFYLVVVKLDHALVDFLERALDYSGGLILSGTILTMVLALGLRFLAVASSSVDAGLSRISVRLDEAGRLYGVYSWKQFALIHWPLLKRSFASGFLLVFVDVIKEMPLTLMTRPFGWDSLSVRIYSLTSEGEWERAALPALLLVVIGTLPLFLFQQKRS
ncbi:ABC transporter permease [Oligoflexus tunisiensis]|uniref:ABC transporter permease n=1 Tax=Oligoflexus tunisiensis TaxID=708132 RepID=UPI000AFDA2F7|nr:iron ABC transporter permease [Oligoflexus tunisiensis]